jgi:antitoxin component of RelBE/YafQ-DinJ toxin-antitoxin module
MDAKVTLSFDAEVIESAKKFAARQGLSLSRFVELLLRKAMNSGYQSIEELPISEWVSMVAEGDAEYHTPKRKRKDLKDEFFKGKK